MTLHWASLCFRWQTGCQCPPVPHPVSSVPACMALAQPKVWPRPVTVTPDPLVQLNPVFAAVIIPVLNYNNSVINTCLWGFVFGLFWFIDLLLSLHNKAQCIFQGLVTSVYSQPCLTYKVPIPHRAGEGGCKDLTAFAFLLLSVGIWSDLGLPGLPWDQTQSLSQICSMSSASGLQGQR